MSKVYIPSIPHVWDHSLEKLVPKYSLDNLSKFGEVVVLTGPKDSSAHPEVCARIKDLMSDVQESDFLLCMGNPGVIAIAACYMSDCLDGQIRILQWDSKRKLHYIVSHDLEFDSYE